MWTICVEVETLYLITYSYCNMSHFDLALFSNPQTLPLDILNPNVNTCDSIRL